MTGYIWLSNTHQWKQLISWISNSHLTMIQRRTAHLVAFLFSNVLGLHLHLKRFGTYMTLHIWFGLYMYFPNLEKEFQALLLLTNITPMLKHAGGSLIPKGVHISSRDRQNAQNR